MGERSGVGREEEVDGGGEWGVGCYGLYCSFTNTFQLIFPRLAARGLNVIIFMGLKFNILHYGKMCVKYFTLVLQNAAVICILQLCFENPRKRKILGVVRNGARPNAGKT